jgi:hypothetical protein
VVLVPVTLAADNRLVNVHIGCFDLANDFAITIQQRLPGAQVGCIVEMTPPPDRSQEETTMAIALVQISQEP